MSAQPRRTARAATLALAGVLLTAGCAAGQVASTADQKPSLDGNNASVGTMDLRAIAIQPPPRLTATYRTGSDAFLNVVLVNNGRSADRLVGIRTTAATSWAYFSDHNDAYTVQQATASSSGSSSESASESASASSSESASGSPSGSASDSASGSAGTAPSGTESAGATGSSAGATGSSAGSSAGATGASDTSTGSATGSATSAPPSSASPSSTPLPTGTKSVTIPVGGRVGFGTPESTGGLLLTGLTKALNPGDTVRITFTFAKAGSVSVSVPVQLSDLPRTAAVPGGEGEG